MTVTYGIDVGATTVKAAAVTADGAITADAARPTPTDTAAAVEAAILDVLAEVRSASPGGRAVGIGTPGWTSADRRTVHYSPNLPWRDEPVADRVEAATGLRVVLENDANAAAWAEFRFGAGRDATSMVAYTLGSGVGGAIVINGTLVRGASGRAGELGHCVVETGGHQCACGRTGCLENYASGRSLMRRAEGTFGSAVDLLALAEAGDSRALDVYRAFGRDLGRAMANVVMAIDPDVIVVGGGVADAFSLFADQAGRALRAELGDHWGQSLPKLVPATLGTAAGRIGCADLARNL